MKNLEEIDITKPISKEDFYTIFESQLPLNQEEKIKIKESYFPLYIMFITNGVEPAQAFDATKNIFYSQETQLKKRLENTKKQGS